MKKGSNFLVLMTYQSLTTKYVLKQNNKNNSFQLCGYSVSSKIDVKLDREVEYWKLYMTHNFGNSDDTFSSAKVAKNRLEAYKFFKALTGVQLEGIVLASTNTLNYEQNKLEAIQAITQSN